MQEPCIYEHLLDALHHVTAGKAALENSTVEEVPQVHLQVRFYLRRSQQATTIDSYDVRVVIRVLGETPIQKLSDHTSSKQSPSQHCIDEDVLIIPKAVGTGQYAAALASQLLQTLANQSSSITTSGLLQGQFMLYLKRFVETLQLAEGKQHRSTRLIGTVAALDVRDSCTEIHAIAPPDSPPHHGANSLCKPYRPALAACTPAVISSEQLLCSTYISLLIYLRSQHIGHRSQPTSKPSKNHRRCTMKQLMRFSCGRNRGMPVHKPVLYALKKETNNERRPSFASKSIRSNPLFSYDGRCHLDAMPIHGYDVSVPSPQELLIGTVEDQHKTSWHTNSWSDPFHQPSPNTDEVKHGLSGGTLTREHSMGMSKCRANDTDDDSLCTETYISCEESDSGAALIHSNSEPCTNTLKEESSLQRLAARRRDARHKHLHHIQLSRATTQHTLMLPPLLNTQQKCLTYDKSKQETLYKTQAMIQQAVVQVASLRDALTSLRTTIGTPCA